MKVFQGRQVRAEIKPLDINKGQKYSIRVCIQQVLSSHLISTATQEMSIVNLFYRKEKQYSARLSYFSKPRI